MDELASTLRTQILLAAGVALSVSCRTGQPVHTEPDVVCLPPVPPDRPATYEAPFDRCAPPPPPGHESLSFSQAATLDARKGDPTACCYTRSFKPEGRPLRSDGEIVLAAVQPGDGYRCTTLAVSFGQMPAAERERLVRRWLEAALVEHSSIGAFARLSLDLLGIGAPSELVSAAHAAAQDEIRHANALFELASAAGGSPVSPGPLALPHVTQTSMARLIQETVIDGCFGEALGAAEARFAAARCELPAVRTLLETIADDEARHAGFAFRLLRYLLAQGGPDARLHLEVAVGMLGDLRDERSAGDGLERYGVLGPGSRAALRAITFRDVVSPLLEAVTAPA